MNATTLHLSRDRWDELTRALGELCVRMPVSSGSEALAREASKLQSGLSFREVLCRGGWYRLGGVVTAQGDRVADDLEHWVESQLAAYNDDLGALFDAHAGSGLLATRLTGKTHYLVALIGDGAGDFLQLEVEEIQEVVSHALFDGDVAPASIEELVDPRYDQDLHFKPIGIPVYSLRRVTDVGDFLSRMWARKPEPQPIHRFIEAWEKCSAGHAAPFSSHWVLAVREHLDRYHQTVLHATPAAALNGQPPRLELGFGAQGLALQTALQRFDRQAGYPMAWFFHMLTTKAVPHAVATAVINDLQAGFNYLPDRDAAVIKDWLYKPYGF